MAPLIRRFLHCWLRAVAAVAEGFLNSILANSKSLASLP